MCCFWSTQCELCKFCLTSVELNSCCSCARAVQHIRCLLLSLTLSSVLLSDVIVSSGVETRARNGSRKSHAFISSFKKRKIFKKNKEKMKNKKKLNKLRNQKIKKKSKKRDLQGVPSPQDGSKKYCFCEKAMLQEFVQQLRSKTKEKRKN